MSEPGRSVTKQWLCATVDAERRMALAREAGVSPVVAGLLLARGIADAREARAFLEPDLDQLHDPFLLPDVEIAVARLAAAIQNREQILVHGDYDVDGVTSAALMTRVLKTLCGNVDCFVPHRMVDGYDLHVDTVRKAAAGGVRVIVTVDCGVSALEAARCARELGIDLIVTDHHQPGPELPEALAVINPKRPGCAYPFPHLSGVGVAFKVATALVRHLGITERTFRTSFLDLVALGTAADCMPLLGENRVFVKFGLEALRTTKKVGLQALMRSASVAGGKLTARSLGFVLGPRINAVGRLDAAQHALNLMLTADPTEASHLADLLERCNQDRQTTQNLIYEEALEQVRAMNLEEHCVLVLASQGWHSGIVGIVASKIVEAFCRPAVMIALDGGVGRGSARSIHGFNIYEAIDGCRELLGRCGGHDAAAGFDIDGTRVEEFRRMLCRVAAEKLSAETLVPRLQLDAYLDPCDLALSLARDLERMEPFGHGNPEPVFATRALRISQVRTLEPRQRTGMPHLKLFLAADGGPPVEALYWRNGHKADELAPNMPLDLCYGIQVNEYRGVTSLQLEVKDLRISLETS